MIGVIATIRVKPGSEPAFEETFRTLTAEVKAKEPGNRMYQLVRSREEPSTYKVMEVYQDDAALEAHRKSDHYREGGRSMRELCQAPPVVEVLDAIL